MNVCVYVIILSAASNSSPDSNNWSCPVCTYENDSKLKNHCEMCNSLNPHLPAPPPPEPVVGWVCKACTSL